MSKLKLKTENFFQKVYFIVQQIPKGKVSTYGQISRALGTRDARRVGHALHANKSADVPCHRVVNKNGGLAKKFGFGGWREQAKKLKAEGIKLKENKVNLKEYQLGKLG